MHTAAMLLAYGVAECGMCNLECTDGPQAIPVDPYLATGLEFFLAQEPDLMSSMALVHSRVKAVVFRDLDPLNGALASHFFLHDLRTLNHRFRVFHLSQKYQ
jgi:tRNA-specific adenosine deaminase 3